MDDRAPRGGLPALADARTPDVGASDDPGDRLSGYHLLCGAEGPQEARLDGRGRPRTQAHVRQAGHSARGADGADGRGGRCRDGLRLGEDHLQGDACREGDHLLFNFGGAARPSRPGEKVPRERRSLYRQLLRRAERRGLLRRVVLLHPQGGAVPDGAVDLLPHQRPPARGSSSARSSSPTRGPT